jgi:hypothetical protein
LNSSYHPDDSEENEGIVVVFLETRWEKSPAVIPENEEEEEDDPGSNSAIVQSSFPMNGSWPMRMVPNDSYCPSES